MTAPTRDEVIQMAREAGTPDPMVFLAAYERLAAAAYAKGQEDMRERCAQEGMRKAGNGIVVSAAIRALPIEKE